MLSPGAEPIRPPIPGIDQEGIFTLRSVPDTDAIKSYLERNRPRRAVIVGAGFIGLEMAENLRQLGIWVTIVEMAEQVMTVLDYEMAAEVHQHLKTKQVELFLKDGVSSFAKHPKGIIVTLQSGRQILSDLIILSIGVRPENRLAKHAGIELGATGGIRVDKYLRTSAPDVYALGDAVEFPNPIIGKPLLIPLAGPANKQGRIVADNIVFGDRKTFAGSIATAIAKVFDLTVATTGVSEKVLKREHIPYASVVTHSSSHAGYYPGATAMSIKTLFAPESGKLLGAQIVGYEGVDKRIDLFAAVLRNGGTVRDLGELEHAYAPPYSSAKDPVNIAGFVAENILDGQSSHVHWDWVIEKKPGEIFLLDVRTAEEHALGTIRDAVNINVNELRGRIAEVPRDRTVVVFCGVGLRAYIAERILRQNGFTDVHNLSGGFKTWSFVNQKQGNEDIFANDFIGKDDDIYQADVDGIARAGAGQGQPADSRTGSGGSGVMPFAGGFGEGSLSSPPEAAGGGFPGRTDGPDTGTAPASRTVDVNAVGLQCPGPIMRLRQEIERIAPGDRIRQTASDPGFGRDVQSWCNMTGNRLVELSNGGGAIVATVEKIAPREDAAAVRQAAKDATMVIFSDSMDRALASFVIANGAASAGKQVTMFFTFWGLSILKKDRRPGSEKDLMSRIFGAMLPGSSRKLGLSKMNFGGMGSKMMRFQMKQKHVDSLEDMIGAARASGIRLVACQMSMDVMGISKDELIDGIEIGGVATYLEATGTAGLNLFI